MTLQYIQDEQLIAKVTTNTQEPSAQHTLISILPAERQQQSERPVICQRLQCCPVPGVLSAKHTACW
jgi:hypothetical protein